MPRSGERDRAKERYWRKVFADWNISALSGAEYCRRHEISYSQFQDWRKTLKRRDAEVEARTAELQREHRERLAARRKDAAQQAKRVESDLLTREEAAAYLGVEAQTLAVWRTTGRYSLPSVKVGRLIRYRRSDLDAFLAARTSDRSPKNSESNSEAAQRAIEFAEVRIVDCDRGPALVTKPLEIVLPGGMTLRVADGCSMQLLASVMSVLGGS